MILSNKSKNVLKIALASGAAQTELLAALGSHAIVMAVVATHTSTTTDFPQLAVGDIVVRIKQGTTGGAIFDIVTAAGTLPTNVLSTGAAVIGDLYVALRAE